jgi:anti-anti-sigma factor
MTNRDLRREMTSGQLTHSVVSTASAVVLVLAGVVDFAMSAELRRTLDDLVRSSHAEVVVVDLSEVRLIDAAAVGVIVSAHASAAARGRQLYVDGLGALPARVFAILGLDSLRLPDDRQRAWPSLR